MTPVERAALIAEHNLGALSTRTVNGLTTAVVARGGVRSEVSGRDGEESALALAIAKLPEAEAEAAKAAEKAKAQDAEVDSSAGGVKTVDTVEPEVVDTVNPQGTEVKPEGAADQGAPAPGSDASPAPSGKVARGSRP